MALTYRQGAIDDSEAVFLVFEESFADLLRRMGETDLTSFADPVAQARRWGVRRPLYEHLARTAEQFWVAEDQGRVVGFARSILRDGVRELTEFFVLPAVQSGGVGRELLHRAFPVEGAVRRAIIAAPEPRAQALYLRAGVFPGFPVNYWGRTPELVDVPPGLEFRPLRVDDPDLARTLATLDEMDRVVLGHCRTVDHRWLLANRQGYLYLRHGQPAGYGYEAYDSGPFALLDPTDFPSVLAHAERSAAAAGGGHFGVEVPMINRHAVNHLLARHFQLGAFSALFLCDAPFGRFDQYLFTSPPFFM